MKKGTTRDDPHNPLSTILGLADHRNGSVMHAADGDPGLTLELWDYRRRVADLYSRVRRMEPAAGWTHWVSTRNDLFRTHPQSPVPASGRASFPGLSNFDYDPELRVTAMVEPAPPTEILISHSGPGATPARTFGRARFGSGRTSWRWPCTGYKTTAGAYSCPSPTLRMGATPTVADAICSTPPREPTWVTIWSA